jgi:hypothetical protein
MEMILILIVALVVFDLVTFVWGFDSRDSSDATEWERRRNWAAFH